VGEFLSINFWLLCGAWSGGAGALYFRARLASAVASGALESQMRDRFVRGWFLAIMIPCAALWILQISAGPAPNPQYISWPDPQRWAAIGVILICWGLLLSWVWLSNGAELMARLFSLASRRQQRFPFGAAGIKVLSILIVISGLWAMITSYR
jgi:hypothetical protein